MYRRNKPEPFPISPKNAFVEKNLYRTVDEKGASDFEPEDTLSYLESQVAPIIMDILKTVHAVRDKKNPNFLCSGSKRTG